MAGKRAREPEEASVTFLPTRAKVWSDLDMKWLILLLQTIDNDWVTKANEHSQVMIDRPTMEAVLQHALGITPETAIPFRKVEPYFSQLSFQYASMGTRLRGLTLSQFQDGQCRSGPAKDAQSRQVCIPGSARPSIARPSMPHQPEIIMAPDGKLIISAGRQSKYLHSAALDWELIDCRHGPLVFSRTLGQAQMVSIILATAETVWPCNINTSNGNASPSLSSTTAEAWPFSPSPA
jgi:hypothetical protein